MAITRKTALRYEKNLAADPGAAADGRGLLNGQARPGLGEMAFGASTVARAGCESIAVYNALLLLRRPRPLAEIIRDMESRGYMRLGGHFGAAPYFRPLMRRYGADTGAVLPSTLRKRECDGTLASGSVFLMVIWNRRGNPLRGLHTFTAVWDPDDRGGWEVFNRFNNDLGSRRYSQLNEILRSGAHMGSFLVIYRVTSL